MFAPESVTKPLPVLLTITPLEPFPIPPETVIPPAALEPSVRVLPPLLTAPATVKRLVELFVHDCSAPQPEIRAADARGLRSGSW